MTALLEAPVKERKPWQFQPGNKAAVGHKNHTASTVTLLRRELLSAVTPQEFRSMVLRMVEIVKHGSARDAVAAFTLLSDRLLGKAKESIEITTTDQSAPQLSQYSSEQIKEMLDILSNPAAPASETTEVVIDASTNSVQGEVITADQITS